MKNTLFTIATISTLGVGGFISLSANAHADAIPNPPKVVALDTTTGNNLNSTKFQILEKEGSNSSTLGPFTVNDDYSKEIKSMNGVNKDCSDSQQTITFKQVGTDDGYKITDGTITLCRASGGWLIDSLHLGASGSMSFDDSNGVIYINDEKSTLNSSTTTSSSSASPTTTNSTITNSPTTEITSSNSNNSSNSTNTTYPTSNNSQIASSTGQASETTSSTPSSTSSSDSHYPVNSNNSTNNASKITGSVIGPKVVTDFVADNSLSSIVTIATLSAGAGVLTVMKKKNK